MEIEGRCHCGQLAYRATLDLERVVVCHCDDCQMLSGSAYRAVAFTTVGDFEITAGEIKEYVKTTAASGNPRAQGFCPHCGSGIYATSVGAEPKSYGVRVGTIKQRKRVVPRRQVWRQSALPWVDGIRDLPGIPGQPQ